MTKALRESTAFAALLNSQQTGLLWQLELFSRGLSDVKFDRNTSKKILVTGFDPFFLDKNIDQSNPSGVAALALDDLLLTAGGQSGEIETLMIPVRFADFDAGLIEQMLTPFLRAHSIDLLVTISMGRDNFDLERFPGLRRSASAPDNLNVFTGANEQQPLVPLLQGKPLTGPEFIEFSLPATAMLTAKGEHSIHDNHRVTTLTKTFEPKNFAELANEISVKGSGGGYLSNEISYRSLVLRDRYWPTLPVGHIHTPRINAFAPATSKQIVNQIKAMLTNAVTAL